MAEESKFPFSDQVGEAWKSHAPWARGWKRVSCWEVGESLASSLYCNANIRSNSCRSVRDQDERTLGWAHFGRRADRRTAAVRRGGGALRVWRRRAEKERSVRSLEYWRETRHQHPVIPDTEVLKRVFAWERDSGWGPPYGADNMYYHNINMDGLVMNPITKIKKTRWLLTSPLNTCY